MWTRIERVQKDIEALVQSTSTPGKGVTRLSYSKEDIMAKYYLAGEMKKVGFKIYEDEPGTPFGYREGTMKNVPVVILGSHYDSVVSGGAFDGVVSSVPILKVMCTLIEEGFMNNHPLGLTLVNTGEGITFGPGTGISNSRAMLGTMTRCELEAVKNRFGQTKLEAVAKYGLKPDLEAVIRKPGSIENFLKLHIEQGLMLERESIEIGLIRYLTGIGRYTIRFHSATANSTVPVDSRKDVLVAAASLIVEFDRRIKALGPDVTGTVGRLDVTLSSNQFVSKYVEGKIEVRTFNRECIEETSLKELIAAIPNAVSAECGIRTEPEGVTRINYPNPTGSSVMCAENAAKMETTCEELGYSHTIISNGTGYDSMIMTDFCNANMICVLSSRGGVFHCPEEWTEYASIKEDVDVLLHLVMGLNKDKQD